jgi:SSS family solute:Na+ symporter
MSGMAGNITAFNTVFTYDIYQTYMVKGRPDRHYLRVGKAATVVGTMVACASSFIVLYFNNLMDYMQLIGILFISPFFIVFLLGMFWKRPSATAGFLGMVAGLSGAALEYVLYRLGILRFHSPMASNIWTAVWGFVAGLLVTVVASYLTEPPREESLKGLVYSRALERPAPAGWYRSPKFYAAVVIIAFFLLNWKFF